MKSPTQKPKPQKGGPTEAKPGQQQDDNIDDLGRPVNDPSGKPLDQPTK
ncbi:hypothetical protein [Devosia sp. 2618]